MSGPWNFHPVRDFGALQARWQAVNLAGPATPLLSPAFIAPLIEEFSRGDELLALRGDPASPDAMALLARTGAGRWQTFQAAQSPLGAWVHRPPHTLGALAPELLKALPGLAQIVGISQQDPDLLPGPLQSPGAQLLEYIRTARVTISGSFDDYWAARGKNLRNNLRKQRARLEKEGVALRMETVTDPAQVARAVEDYGRLESAGWKSVAGTAVSAGGNQGRFYQKMLESFCREGSGRIYRLWYGQDLAAIDLCICGGDALIVLKTTYNEAFGDSSPSSLLRQAYFRELFEEGRVRRIEFYGRVMEWHTRWTDEVRTMYHVNHYRWPWLSSVKEFVDSRARPSRTPQPGGQAAQPGAAGATRAGSASVSGAGSASVSGAGSAGVSGAGSAGVSGAGSAGASRAGSANASRVESAAGNGAGSSGTNGAGSSSAALEIRTYDDLAALPAGFEPLFARAGRSSPFHTLWWYRNFIEAVLDPGRRLRIFALSAGGAPRAVLPMREDRSPFPSIGTRRLTGVANFYSSLFGPVIDPDERDLAGLAAALARAIRRDGTGWDVVNLQPLDADAPLFRALAAGFRQSHWAVQTYFCFGNWYLQVRGRRFAEYFDALPSQLRHTVTRKRRQLERAGTLRLAMHRDGNELEAALAAYQRIYASSWKVPEPYPRFIEGLCRACAQAGALRLGVAHVNGEPAAAQIWIVGGGVATIYKLAYDARFAKFSLGSILTAHLMQEAIDSDGVKEVDYLTGDDDYKKDWMSHRRERWGIIAFNARTARGLLAAARHIGGRAANRAARRLLRAGQAAEAAPPAPPPEPMRQAHGSG